MSRKNRDSDSGTSSDESEAVVQTDSGDRYRSLEANKSGESSDDSDS
jgi:hypothetical protein